MKVYEYCLKYMKLILCSLLGKSRTGLRAFLVENKIRNVPHVPRSDSTYDRCRGNVCIYLTYPAVFCFPGKQTDEMCVKLANAITHSYHTS